MANINEAFFAIIKDAKPAKAAYVSLYMSTPFYGGPEEGGWWGSDAELVAYHQVPTGEQAEALADQISVLADEMSAAARDDFNRGCAAQTEWLEARGLDDDFLPEVDGEVSYFVVTESEPGSLNHEGDRYYS